MKYSDQGMGLGLPRAVLIWRRESVILRLWRRLWRGLLQTDMATLGIYWMALGVVSLGVEWVRFSGGGDPARTVIPILITVSAAIPLGMRKSLWQAILESRLLRWLMLDLGALWIPDRFLDETPRRHPISAALAGVIAGLAGAAWSPLAMALILPLAGVAVLFAIIPELALLTLLFALPLMGLLPHAGITLAFGAAICDLFCAGKLLCGKRQWSLLAVDRLALALGGLFLLGGLVSHGRMLDGLLRGGLLLSAWLCGRVLLAGVWRERAVRLLIFSSALASAVGIFQYVTGRAKLQWVDVSRFGDIGGRVCGWFQNPNVFAVFLLLTVPLSLGGIFEKEGLLRRLWNGFVLLIGCLCLLLTWSRGAWLGMLMGVILFLLICNFHSRRYLLLLPVLAFLAFPLLPDGVIHRFQSIGNLADTSANYRIHTWIGVLRMLCRRPWGIGVGESAFRSVFPLYAVSGTERVPHPHNVFLEVFAEIGLGGLLLFLAVLALVSVGLVRRLLSSPYAQTTHQLSRPRLVSFLALLLSLLVMGSFDSLWYHAPLLFLFWIVLSMQVAAGTREMRKVVGSAHTRLKPF